VDFADFMRQVTAACRAGASGVLAGRAVWKEAGDLSGPERTAFLSTTAVQRMQQLSGLCSALGKPWTELYPPDTLPENWYQDYPDL
jgi:tagatose 1,6-diphosphate aldolase